MNFVKVFKKLCQPEQGFPFKSYKNALRGANFALIQNLKRMFLENLFWFGGFKVVLCSQSRKKPLRETRKVWFDRALKQPTDPQLHWVTNNLIWKCTNNSQLIHICMTASIHKCYDLKTHWYTNQLIRKYVNDYNNFFTGGKLPLFLQTSWESLWKIGLIFVKKIEVNDRSQLKTGLKLDRKFATSKKSVGNFSRKSPWCSEIR